MPLLQDNLVELNARVQNLKREHFLLMSQLARAAKCLNAVLVENMLLRAEVNSLQPGM